MAGPGESREDSKYHQNSASNQDSRYQAEYERAVQDSHASYTVPHIPSFDFSSINQLVQQPYPSAQMQMNLPSNKRRRISTDLGHTPLMSTTGDSDMSNFMNAFSTTMVQGTQQQGYNPSASYTINAFASGSHVAPRSGEHTSPLRMNAVPAHTQTFSSPPPLRQQNPVAATSQNDRWAQAREYRRKIHEPPKVDPNSDSTIAEVERDAEGWVTELIVAISNITNVKDTPSSHAYRMFLPDATSSLLIEATAREIFTALLDRCKHGFRGPTSFNKALKPHKDSEPDKTAVCRERMENVVDVLGWNKRACKDVLYEDWKIRLLVNHPLAYDKEKDSQKGSNDQRRLRLEREREKLKATEEELSRVRDAKEAEALRAVGEFDAERFADGKGGMDYR